MIPSFIVLGLIKELSESMATRESLPEDLERFRIRLRFVVSVCPVDE